MGVLKWFDTNNTLGGWTPALHGDSGWSRKLWTGLFLAGTVCTIYGLYLCIESYLQFGTRTTISYSFPDELRLPSITICNENRIHCRNLYDHIKSKEGVSFAGFKHKIHNDSLY